MKTWLMQFRKMALHELSLSGLRKHFITIKVVKNSSNLIYESASEVALRNGSTG